MRRWTQCLPFICCPLKVAQKLSGLCSGEIQLNLHHRRRRRRAQSLPIQSAIQPERALVVCLFGSVTKCQLQSPYCDRETEILKLNYTAKKSKKEMPQRHECVCVWVCVGFICSGNNFLMHSFHTHTHTESGDSPGHNSKSKRSPMRLNCKTCRRGKRGRTTTTTGGVAWIKKCFSVKSITIKKVSAGTRSSSRSSTRGNFSAGKAVRC